MGSPNEDVVLETVGSEDDTNYWHGEAGVHHVLKRTLDEIISG